MKFNILALSLIMLTSFGSCSGTKERKDADEEGKNPKTLVLYYSQTGTTRAVAEELRKELGVDIDSIVAVEPYGVDYDATIERWKKEKEDSVKVAIKPLNVNVNDYDTIFLGYPIWGGTFASPVATFLADNSLEGKTVVTFATFGSGGLESSTKDVAAAQPGANVLEGYGVRAARIEKAPLEINRFLIENGYKKGTVEPLPPFGESKAVNEGDKAIFQEACGNYKFPLGTPVAVAMREYDGIKEYRFDVESQSPDGNKGKSTIYVVQSSEPGSTPEFTRVIRN